MCTTRANESSAEFKMSATVLKFSAICLSVMLFVCYAAPAGELIAMRDVIFF